MIKIATLTAFHGRPAVSELFVHHYRKAAMELHRRRESFNRIELHPFAVCTTGDPQPVIPDVICPNEPVSEKHNRLGEFICDYSKASGIEFDYVMQFGSDDVFSPDIFELYKPALAERHPMIGLKDMVFCDVSTGKTKIIHGTQLGNCFGAGRMIRFDFFRKHNGRLWPKNRNSGLDWFSFDKLGLKEAQFSQRNKPVCVDLKTSENIWKFDSLKGTEIEKPEWVEI